MRPRLKHEIPLCKAHGDVSVGTTRGGSVTLAATTESASFIGDPIACRYELAFDLDTAVWIRDQLGVVIEQLRRKKT